MKSFVLALLIVISSIPTMAQVKKVTLQASGLTCSMCSKAVLNALKKVSFVDKVDVDIKNQEYQISFKKDSFDFDALSKAVEDAGFSVAKFTVSADLDHVKIEKDEHVLIGGKYFHFLNGIGKELNGPIVFTVVDKDFTSSKNYKKYSALSKMECVQTGHAASCCSKGSLNSGTRIYHAII